MSENQNSIDDKDNSSTGEADVSGTAKSQNQSQNDNKKNDSQLDEIKAQAEKFKSEYLYLRADFDNYKKHVIKERADYLKYGSERLIVDLLSIIDNFDRALEAKTTSENFQDFVKGVQMTAQDLKQMLQKNGVKEVESLGLAFDPNMHEALSSEPAKDIPAGHITKVFKKPYKLHEKLIRPGQVVVSKGPA